MDRSRNRQNKFTAWLTAIAAVFILCAIAYSKAHSADTEGLTRALYHAKELENELERAKIKDKEVLLRKVKFIRERIREEMVGNSTNIKDHKKIK